MFVAGIPAEVATPERNPPVFVEDRPLESLDESVGPCVPGFRTGMADIKFLTYLAELTFEFATSIGQYAPQP